MNRTKNVARVRDLSRLRISPDTRAAFDSLLAEASKLGVDPEAVAVAGLSGLRGLLALKQAAESGSKAKRDAHLAQLQGTLRVLQYRKHPELVQRLQARAMALQGRGGDTEVAHVTLGEIVLPKALQTPGVLNALRQAAEAANIPINRLRVGSIRNAINPHTGQPEFFDPSEEESIEEITITAPHETGLVQVPQGLSDEFRVYHGKPPNGESQYGTPAAMELIGAASKAWTADGRAPFSVGDLSLGDGSVYGGHVAGGDHTKGTGIDIRPIRTDGKNEGVSFGQPGYDREATQKLVDTLRATGGVQDIYFNDPEIKGVQYQDKHDNHLHVRVNPNYRRPPGR